MRCVRIWFCKTGRVKYVSHLDLMRCMMRAVRRAKIPLWYTEGFNPHPYLNFLQPMPLGIAGLHEPLDIRIEGDITDDAIQDRLNAVLPDGIEITAVRPPYLKANDIAFGQYEILFENEAGLAEELSEAMNSGGLVCEKTGKVNGRKKMKQVNVSENIKKYSLEEKEETLLLSVVFPCGNTKNVNPLNLLTALNAHLNRELSPLSIVRLGLLDENLNAFE